MMICLVMITGISVLAKERPKITAELSVEIARPKKDCKSGFWFCNPKADVGLELSGNRAIHTLFTDNGNGTMTVQFMNVLPEKTVEFYADMDEVVEFPQSIANYFGYKSLKIVPGTYKLAPASNGNFGSVTISIKTQ